MCRLRSSARCVKAARKELEDGNEHRATRERHTIADQVLGGRDEQVSDKEIVRVVSAVKFANVPVVRRDGILFLMAQADDLENWC